METLSFLQNERDNMISLLKELVNRDTPSGEEEALSGFAHYLAAFYREVGCDTEIIKKEKNTHLKARWGIGEETILLLCHMDTVWPLGEAERRPFKIEGNKAFGPGVFDMKAGITISVFALKALYELQLIPDREIVIFCNSDEETGSITSRPIIEKEAEKSRAVLVLEPSAEQDGAIKTSRKGVGIFKLEIRGKESHAGAAPEKGISAVKELALQILKLEGMNDSEAGVTVNVGVVEGGSRSNVIPGSAVCEIDLRVVDNNQAEKYTEAILGLQPQLKGIEIKVTGGMNRPPLVRSSSNLELYQKAEKIASVMDMHISEGSSGGGSDGNFTAAMGVPTLDGMGAVGGGGHALDEYVLLPEIIKRAALLAEMLRAV